MLRDPHGTPTFITEALYLVDDVQLLNCHLLLNKRLILRYLSLLWLEFTTRFITKAMPINNIDSRCCIKKPENSIAYITGYSGFISRELFLLAWGVDTHTHTDVRTKVISRNQARAGRSIQTLKIRIRS